MPKGVSEKWPDDTEDAKALLILHIGLRILEPSASGGFPKSNSTVIPRRDEAITYVWLSLYTAKKETEMLTCL